MLRDLSEWLYDLSRWAPLGWTRSVAPLFGDDGASEHARELGRRSLERRHPRRMTLEVIEVRVETASTRTLRLRRVDGPLPPHRPGQYVNLFVSIDGVRTSRPFSIASAPGESTLELTVRAVPGGFVSRWLCQSVAVGDVLTSTGPMGDFCHEPLIHGRELLLIAGGSGVTPLMSMIRDKRKRGLDSLDLRLLYGCRDHDDVIYKEELAELAASMPGFGYHLVFSEPPAGASGLKGLIDAPLIRDTLGAVSHRTVYLCGPNAMYGPVTEALHELGLPTHRIVRESFGPSADVTKEPGWPDGLLADRVFSVKIVGRGTIGAVAGEPLMNALERQGIVIPTRCRSGQCSACQTTVLEGQVYMPPSTVLRESAAGQGFVHACVSYPIEDLVIRIPPER